ncbi:ribosome maturation factor RimM [Alkalimarinus alittae]|uniref:Ribosome maturation factor RimM n=1 Tax=Alkalimarinus alittae TaxID=2961619 RepID=A0ABY6MZH0_9ALTE|nr:ribosome maturation factor RimM [Alkalimarinus alittae]UZE95247.1 ribosome maturation factor RimM [Alkalimarinus alittae]
MSRSKSSEAVLGKITSVYGVKGWVKIYSFTDPIENILQYRRWTLKKDGVERVVDLSTGKKHGKGLVACIEGCNDRELAQQFCGSLIVVSSEELPELDDGEFYWHQLEGLSVKTIEGVDLGKVSHLIETGSNDVMVVKGNRGDAKRERLIPYLPGEVVTDIDLEEKTITVDWDPEF